jgi:hypothetical protein
MGYAVWITGIAMWAGIGENTICLTVEVLYAFINSSGNRIERVIRPVDAAVWIGRTGCQ